MKPCRECQREVSEQALTCPQCGAPYPARASWDGWGYEYKSQVTIAGLPDGGPWVIGGVRFAGEEG